MYVESPAAAALPARDEAAFPVEEQAITLAPPMRNVTYGKCVKCGKTYEAAPDLTTCECGGILDITYGEIMGRAE